MNAPRSRRPSTFSRFLYSLSSARLDAESRHTLGNLVRTVDGSGGPDGGTSDPKYAQTDPTSGSPVSNGARNVWVSETALTGSLYLAFASAGLSIFAIVVGIALLLAGIGFLVLVAGALFLHVKLRPARQPRLATSPERPSVGVLLDL